MFSTKYFLSKVKENFLAILSFCTFLVKKMSLPRNMRVIFSVSPKIEQVTYFPPENEHVSYFFPERNNWPDQIFLTIGKCLPDWSGTCENVRPQNLVH
jgi:hypothetical protein